MKFFKKLAPAVALALCFGIGGCGDASFSVKLGYNDGTLPNEDGTLFYREYDESLFYRNDLTLKKVADPSVIYVEEGEYAGKLFLYGTSNTLSVRGIGVWQSDDGVHWDSLRGSVRAGNRLLGLFQPLGARSDLRRRGQILYDLFGA